MQSVAALGIEMVSVPMASGWLTVLQRKPHPNWESDKTFDSVLGGGGVTWLKYGDGIRCGAAFAYLPSARCDLLLRIRLCVVSGWASCSRYLFQVHQAPTTLSRVTLLLVWGM